jgi:SAM-dependent methyltransferase
MNETGSGYIHGVHPSEQERLAALNALTNPAFCRYADSETHCTDTETILEVGSGLGILAREMSQKVPFGYAVGLEFSQGQIDRAKSDSSNIRFIRVDAHVLPFADDCFDLAMAIEIECATRELAALRERDDATGLFHWNRAVEPCRRRQIDKRTEIEWTSAPC